MDLFSVKQSREFDAKTIESGSDSGYEMMKRAGRHLADIALEILSGNIDGKGTVHIFCGNGNNGGDGICAFNVLKEAEIPVELFVPSGKFSKDAERALKEASRYKDSIHPIDEANEWPEPDVAMDALLGTGINRPVSEEMDRLIRAINALHSTVISADIPSGINGDSGQICGNAVKADITVTFQKSKPGLYLFPAKEHVGKILVREVTEDTGIVESTSRLIDFDYVREVIPEMKRNCHKGDNGRLLILGGSKNYSGAAVLCSRAALRTGSGLVYAGIPGSISARFAAAPQIIVHPLDDDGLGIWTENCCYEAAGLIAGKNAICAGPGMGEVADSGLFEKILSSGVPVVLDADALNHLSRHRVLMSLLHKDVVLTPHIGEMSRLTGLSSETIQSDIPGICRSYASEWNCIVLLKSSVSCISDGVYTAINDSGNSGLAKGGSGDILCGIVGSLMGQGISSFEAACAGAFLLGTTADKAFELLKERMLTADDVLSALVPELDCPGI